jgi:uncharacterized protein (TIGR00251 family)
MPPIDEAVTESRNGVILSVDVSPGAKQGLFPAGFNPWRKTIGCRVTAPALEGRANAAVIGIIAGFLHIPISAVRIQSGATASLKKIHISGITRADILERLKSVPEK